MLGETLAALSIAVLVLVLLAFYLSWRATRLDRLHIRVETARAALEAALLRRGAVVLELAAGPGLPPEAAASLVEAAVRARRAGEEERELVESGLSRALRAAFDELGEEGPPRDRLLEAESAAKGVHVARCFHNNAVAETRRARRSRLVRVLRLAGRAPLPDFFEMDDEPPVLRPSAGP